MCIANVLNNMVTLNLQEIIPETLKFIDTIEIEVEELETYRYTPAFNDHIHNPEPPEHNWDEDEYRKKQIETFLEWIKYDGLEEYINISKEDSDRLKPKMILFLENKL